MPIGFWLTVAGCVLLILAIAVRWLFDDLEVSPYLLVIGFLVIPLGLLVWYLPG